MFRNEINNSNKVSNLNINRINPEVVKNEIETIEQRDNYNIYEDFCETYIGEDFDSYKVEQLKRTYEIGRELLNTYYITNNIECGSICESETIVKLQYILNSVLYSISEKQYKNNLQQNMALSKKLTDTIDRAEQIGQENLQHKDELKELKNDVKTIITVIISIVLAISIIPTAIAGIEKVSANYILPFLASVVLFGMIMITFVYSIYQDHLKKSTCFILILGTIICVGLWIFSFNINIEVAPRQANVITEQSEN